MKLLEAKKESTSRVQQRWFLNWIPTVQETKKLKNKITKLQKASSQHRKQSTMKRESTASEKNLCQLLYHNGLTCRLYEDLRKPISKEQSNSVKNVLVTSKGTSPQFKWLQHYKTMLILFSQQENENENHTESPSHLNQNGSY